MKLALITALAAVSFAGAAFADATVTATLDQSQSGHVQLIASDAVWNCAGATCVARPAPDTATGVSGCRALARQIGRISSYSSDQKTLDAGALAKCNAAAATTPTSTASTR